MKQYTVLFIPSKQLNRTMKVFIMLPNSYTKSEKHYPVLYMHDGQNLFDEKLSYTGETWGVAEAYENHLDLPEVIIVGIETEDDRTDLLVPFEFNFKDIGMSEYGTEPVGGMTDKYINFITKELKPHIDKTYRTFKSPKNTAMMGSSFGGVCTTYAALTQATNFSRFACVSNAYYVIQKEMETLAKNASLTKIKKLYLDTGTKETSTDISSEHYVSSNTDMYNILKEKINDSKIRFEIIEGAVHNEQAWRDRFPEIINFLFND